MFDPVVQFIRGLYDQAELIPLHEPKFTGNEREYVLQAIDSTYVSSVGAYVDLFEQKLTEITGARYAVATVNGTAALHMALIVAGVRAGEEVITQPLSFVATANAIRYTGAQPLFLDVDRDTMGLSPDALATFLDHQAQKTDRGTVNRLTGRKISCCVPMHTFGFPARMEAILKICKEYDITVVEDAAESLGSFVGDQHTGTLGVAGIISLNGNKIVTSGGGGAILTNDEELARRAKHLTTTAKQPHQWAYMHDQLGYNYRMPNINAALACAQLEQLSQFLENKRFLAEAYDRFFEGQAISFMRERPGTTANYWLNTILLDTKEQRDRFLSVTNEQGIMTRPAWQLLNELPMYRDCMTGCLDHARWLADRIVNLPSSARC